MMDWDSEIKDTGFQVTPGVYPFEIIDAEQTKSKGKKLPPSPMLKVEIECTMDSGTAFRVTDFIVLHESLEWKVAQFLESIGQKEPGKSCKPNWGPLALIGSTGKVEIENREGQDGNSYPSVKRWLPKEEGENAEFFGKDFKPVDDERIPF